MYIVVRMFVKWHENKRLAVQLPTSIRFSSASYHGWDFLRDLRGQKLLLGAKVKDFDRKEREGSAAKFAKKIKLNRRSPYNGRTIFRSCQEAP